MSSVPEKYSSNQPDKPVPEYFIDKPDGSVSFDLGPGGLAEFRRVIARATGTVNICVNNLLLIKLPAPKLTPKPKVVSR